MECEFNAMLSAYDEELWERTSFLSSVDEINRINDSNRWSGASINAKVNVGELPLEPRSLPST
jgi:hypothetical protein